MPSAWSDADAQATVRELRATFGCNEDVALRVYSSRLIGSDRSLVLHGGGNTSVKTVLTDDVGDEVEVLCVKGSGWDLAAIEPPGFPAVRLAGLRRLRELERLSDEAMVNAARTRMLDASAPNPSVEALLHAFLPHKYIDHSHADAILSLADQAQVEPLVRELYGDRIAVVPYIMPGFALAKLAAEVYEAHPQCEGLLLASHGLFTFGDTANASYERHIEIVDQARAFIEGRRSISLDGVRPQPAPQWSALGPALRGALSTQGRHYVLELRQGAQIRAFVDDPELESLALRGPATPDHVIRTKQKPLIFRASEAALQDVGRLREELGAAVAAYRTAYRAYVDAQCEAKGVIKTPLDPDPRVVLVPGLGLVGIGTTSKAAGIASDLYEHTIEVITGAEAVGRYEALSDGDIFDMEYWSLEQAKLGKKQPPPLAGRVVVVTGAGRGIGAAVARAFGRAGAELLLVDREGEGLHGLADELGAQAEMLDVTDRDAVQAIVDRAVEHWGGVDGLVSNAGTAHQAEMGRCPPERFRASLDINLLAHQWFASACWAVLTAQGTGGFLLFNASKAAFNPGAGFGPYAVAKAALVALMKQYALEGGPLGIRSNAVNADRVRTGLLGEDEVRARAAARGLDPAAYYRSNLLRREVTPEDVAAAFTFLAQAPSTTGSVITVDGGNIAASPR